MTPDDAFQLLAAVVSGGLSLWLTVAPAWRRYHTPN